MARVQEAVRLKPFENRRSKLISSEWVRALPMYSVVESPPLKSCGHGEGTYPPPHSGYLLAAIRISSMPSFLPRFLPYCLSCALFQCS